MYIYLYIHFFRFESFVVYGNQIRTSDNETYRGQTAYFRNAQKVCAAPYKLRAIIEAEHNILRDIS